MARCLMIDVGANSLFQLSKQLDAFRTNLEQFARKHKGDIRRDADFRTQFQQMCATIGVDPLACEFMTSAQEVRFHPLPPRCMPACLPVLSTCPLVGLYTRRHWSAGNRK